MREGWKLRHIHLFCEEMTLQMSGFLQQRPKTLTGTHPKLRKIQRFINRLVLIFRKTVDFIGQFKLKFFSSDAVGDFTKGHQSETDSRGQLKYPHMRNAPNYEGGHYSSV